MAQDDEARTVEVRRCHTRALAEQYALVLAAVGIASEIARTGGGHGLFVAPEAARRALHELAAYERENAGRWPSRRPPVRPALHGLEASLAYCAVLVFFFVAERRGGFGLDWAAAGMARADLILDGAWWRTLTALTLHADLGHLLGNLGFGAAFGLLAAQLLGSGLAWLAILATGALGNWASAMIQGPEHAAVGASTAVFGALGLLAGHTQRTRPPGWRFGLRRWAPVAAGVMLLAFLGLGGEHTDVWAHVAGFALGAGLGFALGRAPDRLTERPATQRACGGLACGLLALAWLVALA